MNIHTYQVKVYNESGTVIDNWTFAASDYDEAHNTGPFNGLMREVESMYPGLDWSTIKTD